MKLFNRVHCKNLFTLRPGRRRGGKFVKNFELETTRTPPAASPTRTRSRRPPPEPTNPHGISQSMASISVVSGGSALSHVLFGSTTLILAYDESDAGLPLQAWCSAGGLNAFGERVRLMCLQAGAELGGSSCPAALHPSSSLLVLLLSPLLPLLRDDDYKGCTLTPFFFFFTVTSPPTHLPHPSPPQERWWARCVQRSALRRL